MLAERGEYEPQTLTLRPPEQVMRLQRLGAAFPTRLSFVRTLLRRLKQAQAKVERREWAMDAGGNFRKV